MDGLRAQGQFPQITETEEGLWQVFVLLGRCGGHKKFLQLVHLAQWRQGVETHVKLHRDL